ncbi:MAG: F0F1 ATP synthase subunit B [Pirellulales bacterium]|nr:F0F1 ATP synthase subunit B [Pirellulales bacterium]
MTRTRFALLTASTAAVACAFCAAAAAAEERGGEAAGGLNPITLRGLNFPGDLTIWTAVVFVVLLLVLWKFAWGPIAEGLDKRERKIADDIAAAENANRKAKELLDEYQQKLDAAGEEVRGVLEQGRKNAEKLGRALIEKAKKDAELEQQRAVERIASAAEEAAKDLADRSAALAVLLAGRIVQEKIDPKQHARLIERTVAGFGKKEEQRERKEEKGERRGER